MSERVKIEAGQAHYTAALAKDGLEFVRGVERRMTKSRKAKLPAGLDGFMGAAAAFEEYEAAAF
jgi:hypothetical protein